MSGETIFKIKNNSVRSYAIAGKLCIAGAGCQTPVEVAKATTFRFEPLFELSEDEMFKSFRGVIASMTTRTPGGKQDLEVMIDGVPNGLTVEDLLQWADEQRAKRGLLKPTNPGDHAKELEIAMNRPPDPLEVAMERAQVDRDTKMAALIARTVLQVMQGQQAALPPAPAAPRGRPRGRNDEKDPDDE